MLWTIPAFLAVWSAVGTDLYVQGVFDETDELNQIAKVELIDAPMLTDLYGVVGDE
jgi:hypothetical protein